MAVNDNFDKVSPKSGTTGVPPRLVTGRGTQGPKIGTSRQKRDRWQPYPRPMQKRQHYTHAVTSPVQRRKWGGRGKRNVRQRGVGKENIGKESKVREREMQRKGKGDGK